MELHNLTPAAGSVKTAKRIGRGAGSGLGGTSTRGHKGAKSWNVVPNVFIMNEPSSPFISQPPPHVQWPDIG